jgi:hypothetical protein
MRRSASDGARGSGAAPGYRVRMAPARDMYDALPADRGAHLRRRNLERLAELEARGAERRARLARAAHVSGAPLPAPWLAPRARPA